MINALARNPAANVTLWLYMGFGLAEATGLFGFVVAILMLFVL
jgi:F0F1-type ATP synthase membrane subunit c/vacuolar-type H+-ATPase subunit K